MTTTHTTTDQLGSLLGGLPSPTGRWADQWGRPCAGWTRGGTRVEVSFDTDGVFRLAQLHDYGGGQVDVWAAAEYRTARAANKRLAGWLARKREETPTEPL